MCGRSALADARGRDSFALVGVPGHAIGARMTAIEAATRAGIDLSLIELSLSYSYDKRAEQHQAALELALELERIGRELRGAAEPAD
jgi:hypothetical protein